MGFVTSRGPLTLAALASAAVPGLDPDTVEGVLPTGPGDALEVAFVSDREHRRWVIRCPKTPAASAHLERSAALLALLARRLTMPVPSVKGWVALPEGGRAAVHSYLTGRLVTLGGIEPGSTLATGLGRTIAQLHNLDPRVYEEAGVPVYDAASYRSRRLAELDRAAATGRVPTGLLGRWERVLDDETLWAFTTTATHGAIGEDTVLATPDDGTGADVDVKSLLGWENAQVADPADDLAPVIAELSPETVDTVLEAYAHARVERPDRHLQERARVIGEMQLVRSMMAAVAAGDDASAEEYAAELRRLDGRLAREDEAAQAQSTSTADSGSAGSESTGAPEETASTVDTQPVRTTPTAATDGTDGTDGSTEDVAPRSDTTPGTATHTTSEGTEDAVQVEHPAAPTPVVAATESETSADPSDAPDPAAPADDTSDPADSADDTSDSSDDGPVDDETEPAATGSADEAEPPSQPTDDSDPITAEVPPIDGDDDDGDDDVVPIRPR